MASDNTGGVCDLPSKSRCGVTRRCRLAKVRDELRRPAVAFAAKVDRPTRTVVTCTMLHVGALLI